MVVGGCVGCVGCVGVLCNWTATGISNSWKGPQPIVSFFNRLAHEKSFHPIFEYERWYDINLEDVHTYKVIIVIIIVIIIIIINNCFVGRKDNHHYPFHEL